MLPADLVRPFTSEQARQHGINKRALHRLLRGGLCRRLDDGLYHLVDPAEEVALALTGLGPDAVLSCESVAVFLGWPLPQPPTELHLVVPRTNTRARWPGAVVHSRRLNAADICEVMGVRLTIPLVAAVDLAGTLPLRDAVVLLDAGLRKGNLSIKGLRKRLAACRQAPGTSRAALAVCLSSRARQSPLESEFRVLVFAAGLPDPVEQFEVRANGVFVGRADFAWPEQRLLVEIDGYEFHREWGAFVQDRRRQNALVLADWRILRYSAADLRNRPDAVVEEVRRALNS